MEFQLTLEQCNEILNQIANQLPLESLELHIEDALEEDRELYSIDVLQHEIEPLYMALAGAKGLTYEVALLRGLILNAPVLV